MTHKPETTEFVCKYCGWNIIRIYPGDEPEEKTCVLCKWINNNRRLSEEEKEKLRIRYARAIRGPKEVDGETVE